VSGAAAPPGIALLENPIREYAWGSRTAIAELQGRSAPTAAPEAELWMGAHPLAPSRVRIDGHRVSLLEWIERHPDAVLGARVRHRFAGRLPFLFKVLAVERPLSIQAHPDARQAREGFDREEALGIGLDAPERSYRDRSHKPELICALTPFDALRGFRPVAEIRAHLEALGAPSLDPERAHLAGPEEGALRSFLGGLLAMEPDRRARVLDEVAAAAPARAETEPALAACLRLREAHPHDIGVLAPLFLNAVRLEPGQAMFLPAGELHAYLHGVAIELMANSDNVLRGGLTAKHVDVPELLRVLRFRATRVEVLISEDGDGEAHYRTPAEEFRLSRLAVAPPAPAARDRVRGVELLLCTAGAVEIAPAGPGPSLALTKGSSCVVPACVGGYRIRGAGTLYCASVPDGPDPSPPAKAGGGW
jgi:mannose-6-phosphate isomerase